MPPELIVSGLIAAGADRMGRRRRRQWDPAVPFGRHQVRRRARRPRRMAGRAHGRSAVVRRRHRRVCPCRCRRMAAVERRRGRWDRPRADSRWGRGAHRRRSRRQQCRRTGARPLRRTWPRHVTSTAGTSRACQMCAPGRRGLRRAPDVLRPRKPQPRSPEPGGPSRRQGTKPVYVKPRFRPGRGRGGAWPVAIDGGLDAAAC